MTEAPPKGSSNPIVYLDVSIDSVKVGRIILELYKNIAPKAAENFRSLCTGEKGIGSFGKPLHFKGSIFHRAITQFMIQGGDIINFDGTGGESIYGPAFEDESFEMKHSEKGILSMANAGPNTNSSQFVITTIPCPQLDGVNVAFGKVLKGNGVVKEVSSVKTENDRPLQKCEVIDCGELLPGQVWGIEENDGTSDKYPPFPEDWEFPHTNDDGQVLEVITNIKESGNYFYTNEDFFLADRKYKKALSYIEWFQKSEEGNTSKDNDLSNNMKLICLLNMAAVKLKRDLFKEAVGICNKVLDIDKYCAKAFYRRGLAKRRLNDYKSAMQDFQSALKIMPHDKNILAEITSLKERMQNYLAMEKVVYEKMLK